MSAHQSFALIPTLETDYNPDNGRANFTESDIISSSANDEFHLQVSEIRIIHRCAIFSHLIFDFNNYGDSEIHGLPSASSSAIEINQLWAIKSGKLISR
jgi:hypothetical protein